MLPTQQDQPEAGFAVSSGYARLPERFHARVNATPVAEPHLIRYNEALGKELGLNLAQLEPDALAALFSGNRPFPGSVPVATAYAGHQFGQFVPQLGDGRALLLGEIRDCHGVWRELQLKGSGPTPYSRGGDGRAALGPVLREYLVSEAMHALGIPATRALAAVTTGEYVFRERRLPGAILTRVAASHVRVGTFEFFAAREDVEATRQLADYVIERHYPECRATTNPALALLQAVVERQARLIAAWMQVGFIHGVMNTDNMAVSGETIDFGPCAFMDNYDPAQVFSSIDRQGRYAYSNQPHAAQWNLARFAETLLPLIDADSARAIESATAVVSGFAAIYSGYWLSGMRRKIGLITDADADRPLIEALLQTMHRNEADFTQTFRGLCAAAADAAADADLRRLFADPAAYDQWAANWRSRLAREPQSGSERAAAMRGVNPAYIPRNHRVEQVIRAAVDRGDYAPFAELLQVLARPYEEQQGFAAYALPPAPDERVLLTYCGT